jgi:MinD superfamily P-loop ATPase
VVRRVAVCSGKGGAGKTTVALLFDEVAQNIALLDCDVESPVLTKVAIKEIVWRGEITGYRAVVNKDRCISCGACFITCPFNLKECNLCLLCKDVCRESAIEIKEFKVAEVVQGVSRNGNTVLGAELLPGNEASGKVIYELKRIAEERIKEMRAFIIDCPPGIACPLISSLSSCNLAVVVIEDSRAGVEDARRLLNVLKTEAVAIVNKHKNKCDKEIESLCKSYGVEVILRIKEYSDHQEVIEKERDKFKEILPSLL